MQNQDRTSGLPGQVRQGDVLIVAIKELPRGAQALPHEGGRVVLAHGEVTGHAHSVAGAVARLFAVSGVEDRFLEVSARVAVLHEEHAPIMLSPGTYRVIRQREYDDAEEVRRVAD